MTETELTQARIEIATDIEFVDSHSCDLITVPGNVFVFRAADGSPYPQPSWVLVNAWQADEGDVEMGKADVVGEISQVSVISIAYCPYCGEHLSGNA